MRGGSLGGGLRLAVLAATALGAGAGVASAASMPDPTGGLVRRTGRDRGNGGHRGKPHVDGKHRNHVSRRVKLRHRKARKA